MRYVHATTFFISETLKIRRANRVSWFRYFLEFPGMYWKFMRLEWNAERRDYGYAPVTLTQRNFDIKKREQIRAKRKAKQKAKKSKK